MFKNFMETLKGFFGKLGNWFAGAFSKLKTKLASWFRKGNQEGEVLEAEYTEVLEVECEQPEVVEDEVLELVEGELVLE